MRLLIFRSLCFYFFISIVLIANSTERSFLEKPDFLDYHFPDEKLPRQNMVRFARSGVMITEFCTFKKNKEYISRECKAWKVYDYVDSGKLIPLIREKGFFTEHDPRIRVANLICKEVNGIIETEVDEYSFHGRRVDPEDFCTFRDGSSVPYKGILLYIYRNAPQIKKEIESERKKRAEAKKKLKL